MKAKRHPKSTKSNFQGASRSQLGRPAAIFRTLDCPSPSNITNNIPKMFPQRYDVEISDVLFHVKEPQKSWKCIFWDFWRFVLRTEVQEFQKMYLLIFPTSCSAHRNPRILESAFSEILGLLCAEQDVGNLRNCTFWKSGTPVCRRKSQKMHFQEFWDSCSQNKTSEISTPALSRILGLLCAERNVENLNKMHFQELWDSCAQNDRTEIDKKTDFRELWDSCAQNKTSEI